MGKVECFECHAVIKPGAKAGIYAKNVERRNHTFKVGALCCEICTRMDMAEDPALRSEGVYWKEIGVDEVYETRWDCRMVRVAPASLTFPLASYGVQG